MKRSKLPLDEWVHALLAIILGVGAIVIGLLVLFGTSGPTSMQMERVAPRFVWASFFLIGAFTALVGQALRKETAVRIGHFIAAVVCTGVAIAFALAAASTEVHASQHGMGAYATLAALHAATAVTFKSLR